MTMTMRLRTERLSELCAARGIKDRAALATAMDVSLSLVLRVINGDTQPGSVFIASLWETFQDIPLEEFFERVPRQPRIPPRAPPPP